MKHLLAILFGALFGLSVLINMDLLGIFEIFPDAANGLIGIIVGICTVFPAMWLGHDQ